MVGQFLPVQIHGSDMGCAVKAQEQTFACQFLPQLQLFAVAADHLVSIVIGIMLRGRLHRMGQPDRRCGAASPHKFFRPDGGKLPSIAKAQHNKSLLFGFFFIIKQNLPGSKKKSGQNKSGADIFADACPAVGLMIY